MASRSNPAAVLRSLLDGNYWRVARPVVEAISRTGSAGLLGQRLSDLEQEAQRLADLGEKLTPNNPYVVALMSDFEDSLRANGTLINSTADALQQMGIGVANQTAQLFVYPDPSLLRLAGVQFNRPNPDVIARFVQYAQNDQWSAMLQTTNAEILAGVRNLLIQGVAEGRGPLATARTLRQAVDGLPAYRANSLMRTLFLTSYREAAVLHRVANANILTEQIRMSALTNACMGCVALHGTRMPLDARVNDHWQGRCFSITVIRGYEQPNITSGADWFASQPEAVQRQQMGGAMYDAWKAGDVRIQDIPETFSDPVFGGMVKAASLKGLLGKDAAQYYQ
jgi:hypothetical protein